MVKTGKCLSKEGLLKENYELGQKIAKLEIQIETLKDVMVNRDLKPAVCPVMPIHEPYYVYPWPPNDTTGDPLPPQPNTTVCYDSVAKVYND